MKEFKASIGETIGSIISVSLISMFIGAVVYFLIMYLFSSIIFAGLVVCIVFLNWIGLMRSVLSLKFEIDEEGMFYSYSNNKLKYKVNLKNSYIGYDIAHDDNTLDKLDLRILENGVERNIDCLTIGEKTFNKMYAEMEKYALKKEPERLN